MSEKRLHVVALRMLVLAEDDNVALTIVEDIIDPNVPKIIGQWGEIKSYSNEPVFAWTFIEEPEELHDQVDHRFPIGPINLVTHPNHE